MTLEFVTNKNTGTDLAYLDGKIIGDVVPDGFGKGGWVTLYSGARLPTWQGTRVLAREFLREAAMRP